MQDILKSSHGLLDSIPATFLLTDIHSKILYANQKAESFFEYAREEMEGQPIRILFLPEDWIYFLPNILFLSRYKNGFDGEALLKQKDGKKIFVHLITSAFKEKGEVFLSFSFQEIQRLKNLQREKLEAERWASLGRMMEEVAHQFRNPIVSIGGYSKRLLKNGSFSSRSQSYISQILQETGRLEGLLKRVEEYVQGARPISHRENIQEVVNTVLRKFSKEASGKGIAFSCNTKGLDGDGQLFIDRDMTTRVLAHILENSLEAIAHNPKRREKEVVEVILSDNGERVEVAVADRGLGIPHKKLGLVFDPFFSTWPDRVGLGLTFVRRAVEEQGGEVQAESRLGKGTKITLLFPKDRRRKVRREWLSPELKAQEND